MSTTQKLLISLSLLTLITLIGCEKDRSQEFEESIKLNEHVKEPAFKLSKCMTEHLKPSAAFQIGYQQILEGLVEGIPGDPSYNKLGFGPPGTLFRTSVKLIDNSAEELAVFCGANRDSWKIKSTDTIRAPIELITEIGFETMIYGIASATFISQLKESSAYKNGKTKAIEEQDAKNHQKLTIEDEIKQKKKNSSKTLRFLRHPNFETSVSRKVLLVGTNVRMTRLAYLCRSSIDHALASCKSRAIQFFIGFAWSGYFRHTWSFGR